MGILISSNNSGIIASGGGGGGGGFTTPDLANNLSFETSTNPLVNFSDSTPITGWTRDGTTAPTGGGSFSIQYSFTSNGSDVACQCGFDCNGTVHDRLWVRVYMKNNGKVTSHLKYIRFKDSTSFNANMGGIFVAGVAGLSWVWDWENSSLDTSIGLSDGQVFDNAWHSLEIDYWRRGDPSGWPSVAFWWDGNQITHPDGTTGAGNAFWQNNRFQAGERQNNTFGLGFITLCDTRNAGNTASGTINLDLISVSSLGRIGP